MLNREKSGCHIAMILRKKRKRRNPMQSSSIALQFESEIHDELFNLQASKIKSKEKIVFCYKSKMTKELDWTQNEVFCQFKIRRDLAK